MTKGTDKKFETVEEIKNTINGQINALKGIVTHLLCLSAMHVAEDRGDENLIRVAKDLEKMIRDQTALVMKGQSAHAKSAAIWAQKRNFGHG
jgi:hypothetical protein